MKKSWSVTVALAFTVAGLLMFGCSTGSSDSNSSDNTGDSTGTGTSTITNNPESPVVNDPSGGPSTPTTNVLEAIEGTWKTSSVSYHGTSTDTDEETITINKNGSYSRLSVNHHVVTSPAFTEEGSSAEKGTVSVSASGILSFVATQGFESDDVALTALPTSDWETVSSSNSCTYALIDGKFYENVCFRSGTGTGLIGTWTAKSEETEEGLTEKNEYTITITATTITIKTVESASYYSKPIEQTTYYQAYSVKDANTLRVTDETDKTTDWPYVLSGDTLCWPKSAVFTKQ